MYVVIAPGEHNPYALKNEIHESSTQKLEFDKIFLSYFVLGPTKANVISRICKVYLFNDRLTCMLMLMSCLPGMY